MGRGGLQQPPDMSLRRAAFWRFTFVYGLLIAPWPGFNDIYARYFRGMGQCVFAKGNDRCILNFEAVPQDLHHLLDTRIVLINRDQLDRNGQGPVRYLELSTRSLGWIPTSLVVALVVATPLPWRRRKWSLLFGLLAIHGFILFSVAIYIWNSSLSFSLIELGPRARQVMAGLEETLVVQMGVSFIVPVLIWMFVTIGCGKFHDAALSKKSKKGFTA